jgi:hypothetical protein
MRIFAATRLCKLCGRPVYAGLSGRIAPGRALWHLVMFLGYGTIGAILFWCVYFQLGLSSIKP